MSNVHVQTTDIALGLVRIDVKDKIITWCGFGFTAILNFL